MQWPCNDAAPRGRTPIMHVDAFVRGKGRFIITQYVPTDEKVTRKFPLLLTTGRILSQYNVGAQTRRTREQPVARRRPAGDPSARRRGARHQRTATGSASRAAPGRPCCAPTITERVQPGVVYTTFHFPESGANVITTDNSDWATNCPEYKVTAVQVSQGDAAVGLAERATPTSTAEQLELLAQARDGPKTRWANEARRRADCCRRGAAPVPRCVALARRRASSPCRLAGRGGAGGAGVQRHLARGDAGHARPTWKTSRSASRSPKACSTARAELLRRRGGAGRADGIEVQLDVAAACVWRAARTGGARWPAAPAAACAAPTAWHRCGARLPPVPARAVHGRTPLSRGTARTARRASRCSS